MKNKTVKNRSKKIVRERSSQQLNPGVKDRRILETVSVYSTKDYESNDGMLVAVWGPSAWHFLHTISFNYPVHPTIEEKQKYRDFVVNLQYVLPCKYCRINLKTNLKQMPLTMSEMKNRETFSRYIYQLHELVNRMLHKKSALSYCDVRERYEHFRSRCTLPYNVMKKAKINIRKKK